MNTRHPVKFSAVSILGERILLAPISESYAEVMFAEFTDEITRLMVPATPTHIGQIYDFIRASIQAMQKNTDLTFVILNKTDREFLGVCALHGRPSPEQPVLGIWLKKSAHGHHYGQEAISVLCEWVRQNVIYEFMVYPCDKNNIASRKVAESLGGVIFRTGEVKSMSGRILSEVAYKIV